MSWPIHFAPAAELVNTSESRIQSFLESYKQGEASTSQTRALAESLERINHALAFPGYRFAPRQISSVASPYHVVQESSPRWPVRPSCYQRTSRACAGTDAGLDMNGQDAMLFRNLAQWLSGNRV